MIIGHSLGGIYARELARRHPDMIERIVLMGSAIRHPLASTNPFVLAWYVVSRPAHHDGGGCVDSLGDAVRYALSGATRRTRDDHLLQTRRSGGMDELP